MMQHLQWQLQRCDKLKAREALCNRAGSPACSRFREDEPEEREVYTLFKVNIVLYARIEVTTKAYIITTVTSARSEDSSSSAETLVNSRRALLGVDTVQASIELQAL